MKILPDNWKLQPVGDICSEIVDCINKTAPTVDNPTPYKMIRTTNVRHGRVSTEEVRYVDEKTYQLWTRRSVPKRNDIVLTREAPLGEVGLIRTDERLFLGQRTMMYRADESIANQNYLYYAFQGGIVQGQIRSWGSGSTVEHLRVPDASKFQVPVPPIKEQLKIAATLTAYDDLIENNRQRITLLEKMAEEIYREWFVRLRFPGHEHTQVHKGVPEGWSMGSLNALCTDVREGVPKRRFDEDIRYVGLEHIPRCKLTLDNFEWVRLIESNKFRFSQGDILFGKIRPYLHKVSLADFEGICSTDAIVIRPTRKHYAEFVLLTVASNSFIDLATTAAKGTKMPRADWGFLSSQQMKIPSDDLLNEFSKRTSATFDLAKKLTKQNEQLANTHGLLLNRLISGTLRVDDLDIQFPPSMQEEAA